MRRTRRKMMSRRSEYMQAMDLALKIPCPRCGAKPGQRCVTASGNRATDHHYARRDALHRAYHLGKLAESRRWRRIRDGLARKGMRRRGKG